MTPSLSAEDKRRAPRMFSTIAHRYDLLNHVLSFNADRAWRRALVRTAEVAPGARVLDVATGTGDVAIAFARDSEAGEVTGVDLAEGMLAVGREKLARARLDGRVTLMEGDALALPFEDASFDVVTIAFGLRNLPDYAAGVAEMARVLRPGGRLLVLEFFPPRGGAFLAAYRVYLGRVLPAVGGAISGSRAAYRYLADSIEDFLSHDELRAHMRAAGLGEVSARRLSGGVAWIYRGAFA